MAECHGGDIGFLLRLALGIQPGCITLLGEETEVLRVSIRIFRVPGCTCQVLGIVLFLWLKKCPHIAACIGSSSGLFNATNGLVNSNVNIRIFCASNA